MTAALLRIGPPLRHACRTVGTWIPLARIGRIFPDGGRYAKVRTVTIGFSAVPDLIAKKVDAATAFWNAEGVTLKQRGVPVHVFRADDFGAPHYPELVIATKRSTLDKDRDLIKRGVIPRSRRSVLSVTAAGMRAADRLGLIAGLRTAEGYLGRRLVAGT